LILADLSVDAVARTRMVQGRRKRFTAAMAAAVERVTIKSPTRPAKRSHMVPSLEVLLGDSEAVYRAGIGCAGLYAEEQISKGRDRTEWRNR